MSRKIFLNRFETKITSAYSAASEVQQVSHDDEVSIDRMSQLTSFRNDLLELRDYNCALKEQLRRATENQLRVEATFNVLEQKLQQNFDDVSAMWAQMSSKSEEIGQVVTNKATSISGAQESSRTYYECSDEIIQEISANLGQQNEIPQYLRLPSDHGMRLKRIPSPPKKQIQPKRKRKKGANDSNASECEQSLKQLNKSNDSTESEAKVAIEKRLMQEVFPYPRTENLGDSCEQSEDALQLKFQAHLPRRSSKTSSKNTPADCCSRFKESKLFYCGVCGKQFMQKGHLVEHLRIHTGEKPFQCRICKLSFTQQSNLSRHLLIHTDEKPFVCDVCERSFRHKMTLLYHKTIHSDEKPYKCDLCEHAFRQHSTLTRHRKIHAKGGE